MSLRKRFPVWPVLQSITSNKYTAEILFQAFESVNYRWVDVDWSKINRNSLLITCLLRFKDKNQGLIRI